MEPEPSALLKFRQQQAARAKNEAEQLEDKVDDMEQEDEFLFDAEDVSAGNKEGRPPPKKPAANTSKPKPQAATRAQKDREELEKKFPNGLGYQLAPFDSNNSHTSHLDLGDLAEGEIDSEKAQFFVCSICSMIALDPKECSDCNSVYCEACIMPWKERGGCCPKKCQGDKAVNVSNIHRYAR